MRLRTLSCRLLNRCRWIVCFLLPGIVSVADDFETKRLDNWHQWRGPDANGIAPHGDPPVKWSESENIKWKAAIPGEGSSTPIVWDDRVFILSAIRTDEVVDEPPQPHETAKTRPPEYVYQFVVICYDRNTGDPLWQSTACEEVPHEGRHSTHSYAAFSPITDGRSLFVSFGSRGIYCFDLDGNKKWQRNFGNMRTRYGWGEATSPALHDGTLVINWDHEDESFIAALDAATGETKWQVPRDEVTSWATPLIVEHDGRAQVVVNGTTRARGYDLKSGEVIWQCGGQTVNAIPSPIARDGVVYCMSGYRGQAAYAIPLSAAGDITDTDKIIWKYDRAIPYVPSPILVGPWLYFTGSNTGVLSCLVAESGEPAAELRRLPEISSVYASPAAAAGRIYFVSRDGTTVVIRNRPELDVLSINPLDDSIDASPAIVGQTLFLRGQHSLYCIEAP